MENKPNDGSPNNSQVWGTGLTSVIRATSLAGFESAKPAASILVMAWIGSLVIHAILLTLFLFVTINVGTANVPLESEVIQTLVDEEKKDFNLTNDDEGLNPDQLLNYDLGPSRSFRSRVPLLPWKRSGSRRPPTELWSTCLPRRGWGEARGRVADWTP